MKPLTCSEQNIVSFPVSTPLTKPEQFAVFRISACTPKRPCCVRFFWVIREVVDHGNLFKCATNWQQNLIFFLKA